MLRPFVPVAALASLLACDDPLTFQAAQFAVDPAPEEQGRAGEPLRPLPQAVAGDPRKVARGRGQGPRPADDVFVDREEGAVKKKRRDKQKPTRIDASTLTADDRAALAAYERRRAYYEQAIEESNVIHHKHICPVCGFPTLDERGEYELCVVCQWEDDGDGDPLISGPPNYTSMTEARIKIAGMLAAFEQTHTFDASLAAVVAGVRAFRERYGLLLPYQPDFAVYLREVLRATSITEL